MHEQEFVPLPFDDVPQAGVAPTPPYGVVDTLAPIEASNPVLAPLPPATTALLRDALAADWYILQERLSTNPNPTDQELAIGAFVQEIQPQARDAVLALHGKGYDIGNVLHAGMNGHASGQQSLTIHTPVGEAEKAKLEAHGFIVEPGRICFTPASETDLNGITNLWNWLAEALPYKGEPVSASFSNAVSFREAAAKGTLRDMYMPHGILDLIARHGGSSGDIAFEPQPLQNRMSHFASGSL